MPMSYVMKVSSNVRVSIPAATRARWQADRVVIVDFGNRLVMRPLPDDPMAALVGKYRGRGLSTDEARRAARAEDAAEEPAP